MLDTMEDKTDGIDANGNWSNHGDLHRPRELLESLVPRMLDHLARTFPEYGFSPKRNSYSMGRSIYMYVISGPDGLQDEAAAAAFKAQVLKEMHRFDKGQGNVLSDYSYSSFIAFAEIDPRYYAQHAVVVAGTEVASRMSLAEFKRTIKAGDTIVLESTTNQHTMSFLGMERKVAKVRSGDFITRDDDRNVYFDFPKANAFACDGDRFRITRATADDPTGYSLYRWIRA